jgi:ankyrin repeat protein
MEFRIDDYNVNVLFEAAKNGDDDIISQLIKEGVNIHADEDYALRIASYFGHANVVRVLLAAGADIHAINNYALQWASQKGHVDVVLALAEYAELNEKHAQKWCDIIVEYSKQHQLLLCVLPLITRWMKA